jgi:Ca2+-binding RTX toxin-like protein
MSFRRAALSACLALTALALPAPFADAKVSVSFERGVLVIQGGKGANKAKVRCGADGNVRTNGKGVKGGPIACSQVVEIDASMGAGKDKIDFSGVGPEFGKAKFPGFGNGTGVAALLGDGDDRFIPSPTAFNLAFGEGGRDRAAGGGARDILSGGRGDDVLNGGGGRDSILGNAGSDRVSGGAGADILSGNSDGDLLIGAAGADILGGGTGNDRLRGGSGPDQLFGGAGKDRLSGGAGKDIEKQNP